MQSQSLFPLVLIFSFSALTSTLSLKQHYRRPVCEPSQSCSYSFEQFSFELCECPGSEPCATGNGVQLKGIVYQFCQSRQVKTCSPGEIAAEINLLQTSINCICPETQTYMKRGHTSTTSTIYVCYKKQVCEAEHTCGVGNPITGITHICRCGTGYECKVAASKIFNHISTQNATCQPV